MNRVCSIFAQVLRLLPRIEFEQAVQKHRTEKHAKGFSCWTQLIAMLFCQLGQARSLREIVGGLASSEGKLKHLGSGATHRNVPPWPTPMNTGAGNCIRRFSNRC